MGIVPAHLVGYTAVSNRFVVYHDLRASTARQLESFLKREFSLLHSVWVDHDAPQQFTVHFGSREVNSGPPLALIEQTLRFITEDFSGDTR